MERSMVAIMVVNHVRYAPCQHKMATVSDPVILHAFAAASQVTVIRAIDHHHPQRHRVPTEVLDPQVRVAKIG